MFPSELEGLLSKVIEQLGVENNSKVNNNDTCNALGLDPSQLLVLVGILGGVLEVTSVVIRRNQGVDVVLTGSLEKKSEKTDLEKIMQSLGKLPFDEVVKAAIGGINR